MPHLQPNEAFLISEGDTFFWHADGTSELTQLVKLFEKTQADGVLAGVERPDSELHKYGIMDFVKKGSYNYLKALVEKPQPGMAPSNLANISRYILTPQLTPYLQDLKPNPQSGEYYLTDAVTAAAVDHDLVIHRTTGEWLDAGNLQGWLQANLKIGRARNLL